MISYELRTKKSLERNILGIFISYNLLIQEFITKFA